MPTITTIIDTQLKAANQIYEEKHAAKKFFSNDVAVIIKQVNMVTAKSHINDTNHFNTANITSAAAMRAAESQINSEVTQLLKNQVAVLEDYLSKKINNQKINLSDPNSTKVGEFCASLFMKQNEHHASRLIATILQNVYKEHHELFSNKPLYQTLTSKNIGNAQYGNLEIADAKQDVTVDKIARLGAG